jgi:hypothetical protein
LEKITANEGPRMTSFRELEEANAIRGFLN